MAPRPNGLEGLPNDIKLMILEQLPELSSLKALVRSSTAYHAAYSSHRQHILSTVLRNELGPDVLFEATAVREAATLNIKDESEVERVKGFLNRYKEKQINGAALDLNALVAMAREQSLIANIVHDYAMVKLSTHPLRRTDPTPAPISLAEKRRVYRAFHRFELYRYLFTPLSYADSNYPPLRDHKIGELFLCIFPAWEVEELACIHDYLVHQYQALLNRCKSTLDDVGTRDLTENLANGHMENCDCLVALGLEFYWKMAKEDSIKEQTRLLIKSFSDWKLYRFLREPLVAHRRSLLAVGGNRSTGNAVWDWCARLRTFMVGEVKGLRSWGYVLWDEQRVRDWNLLKMDPQVVENVCSSRLAAAGLY